MDAEKRNEEGARMRNEKASGKLVIHLLTVLGLFVCGLSSPLSLYAETGEPEETPAEQIPQETETPSESEEELVIAEEEELPPEEVPVPQESALPEMTEAPEAVPEEITESDPAEQPEETDEEINEETDELVSEAEPERVSYDASVITAILPIEPASLSFDSKPALITLQTMFPQELTVTYGGTLEADSDTVTGGETVTLPVTWECLQNYDDELTDFSFVPSAEGVTLREGLELPVIAVHSDNKEYGPVNGYLFTEEEYEIPFVDHRPQNHNGFLLMAKAPLPVAYNGYEEGKLPPVRDQGYEGACWSFSAIGAVETDLIKDGKAGTDLDLSELQLVYFASHSYVDPKGCNTGDSAVYNGGGSYLSNGGNTTIAYRTLANMVGPVNEADVPYSAGSSFVPDDRYAVSSDVAQVTGAYRINREDTDSIKRAILDHGSVEVPFFARTGDFTYNNVTYPVRYSAVNNAFYGTYPKPNHSILLVGWNDEFPKENFHADCQPDTDGAWLARNSWGEDGYGLSGYFWVSYCDAGLKASDYTAYDAETAVYDNCYAFDSVPFPGAVKKITNSTGKPITMRLEETFTVDGGEMIDAVGFEAACANLSATVTVSTANRSVSGSLNTEYAGFYLIRLDEALAVPETSKVTVKLTLNGYGEVGLPVEKAGSQQLGGVLYTAGCGSGGYTLNNTTEKNDARLKLYTVNYEASVTGVELSEHELELKIGKEHTMSAHILPDEATNRRIMWFSSDPNVAEINADGIITAVKAGTAVITAETADGKYTDTCTVTVSGISVTGVTLDRTELHLIPNETAVLTAAVLPADATDKTITWSSSNPNTATVDDNGKVTAKAGGTTIITVTTTDGEFTAECNVTVTVPVKGVTLNKSSVTLVKGKGSVLTAKVSPDNASDQTVSWTSSNEAVASVDSSGKVTAAGGGTAVITVTTADGGYSAKCKVTVTVPVTGVTLNHASLVLGRNSSTTLSATVSPADATNKKVIWKSLNETVATVDSSGKVTAKKAGTALITAVTEDGDKHAACDVTVTVPVTGVTISKTALSIGVGRSTVLSASVSPKDATDSAITWKSSDEAVAVVDEKGTVKARKKGTAIISVTTSDGNKTARCSVTVTDPASCRIFGFCHYDGKDYWYEGGVRQAVTGDAKNIIDEKFNIERGREIYDPSTNAWYWLDACYDGAKATGKEVWMPYIYQNEDDWDEVKRAEIAYESDEGMGSCVLDAIISKKGKWVRYDEDGKMLKGWVTITGKLAELYPDQKGNTYYYDNRTGLMAKGYVTLDGVRYHFDEITGVLK